MSYTINAKTLTNKTNTSAASTSGSVPSKLTPEQLQKIEENRQKALLKLKAKSNSNPLPSSNHTANQVNTVQTSVNATKSYNFQLPNKIQNSSNGIKQSVNVDNARVSINNPATTNQVSPPKTKIDQFHGKCEYLIDEPDRFEILIGYNKEVIDMFKTLNGRKYDPNTKHWNFPIKSHDEIMAKFKYELNNVKIEPLEKINSVTSKAAKFYLITRNRFEVQSEYDHDLQELFKTMNTRKYDPNSKRWSFDLKEYDELIKKIGTQLKKGSISISPLPKLLREVFKDALSGKSTPRIDPKYDLDLLKTKIDMNIIKSLLPFQIEGISFGIQQQGRLFLADDMGLGKTVQGLAIANYYKEEWPLFIIGSFIYNFELLCIKIFFSP
jgi:SNF2 family DNA or RNA helicase